MATANTILLSGDYFEFKKVEKAANEIEGIIRGSDSASFINEQYVRNLYAQHVKKGLETHYAAYEQVRAIYAFQKKTFNIEDKNCLDDLKIHLQTVKLQKDQKAWAALKDETEIRNQLRAVADIYTVNNARIESAERFQHGVRSAGEFVSAFLSKKIPQLELPVAAFTYLMSNFPDPGKKQFINADVINNLDASVFNNPGLITELIRSPVLSSDGRETITSRSIVSIHEKLQRSQTPYVSTINIKQKKTQIAALLTEFNIDPEFIFDQKHLSPQIRDQIVLPIFDALSAQEQSYKKIASAANEAKQSAMEKELREQTTKNVLAGIGNLFGVLSQIGSDPKVNNAGLCVVGKLGQAGTAIAASYAQIAGVWGITAVTGAGLILPISNIAQTFIGLLFGGGGNDPSVLVPHMIAMREQLGVLIQVSIESQKIMLEFWKDSRLMHAEVIHDQLITREAINGLIHLSNHGFLHLSDDLARFLMILSKEHTMLLLQPFSKLLFKINKLTKPPIQNLSAKNKQKLLQKYAERLDYWIEGEDHIPMLNGALLWGNENNKIDFNWINNVLGQNHNDLWGISGYIARLTEYLLDEPLPSHINKEILFNFFVWYNAVTKFLMLTKLIQNQHYLNDEIIPPLGAIRRQATNFLDFFAYIRTNPKLYNKLLAYYKAVHGRIEPIIIQRFTELRQSRLSHNAGGSNTVVVGEVLTETDQIKLKEYFVELNCYVNLINMYLFLGGYKIRPQIISGLVNEQKLLASSYDIYDQQLSTLALPSLPNQSKAKVVPRRAIQRAAPYFSTLRVVNIPAIPDIKELSEPQTLALIHLDDGLHIYQLQIATNSWLEIAPDNTRPNSYSRNSRQNPHAIFCANVVKVNNIPRLIITNHSANGIELLEYNIVSKQWKPLAPPSNQDWSNNAGYVTEETYETIRIGQIIVNNKEQLFLTVYLSSGLQVYLYDPVSNSWGAKIDGPKNLSATRVEAITVDGEQKLLVITNHETVKLHYYSFSQQRWDAFQDGPELPSPHNIGIPEDNEGYLVITRSSIVRVNNSDRLLYLVKHTSGLSLYQFDPKTKSWDTTLPAIGYYSVANGFGDANLIRTLRTQVITSEDSQKLLVTMQDKESGVRVDEYDPISKSWKQLTTSTPILSAPVTQISQTEHLYLDTMQVQVITVNNQQELLLLAGKLLVSNENRNCQKSIESWRFKIMSAYQLMQINDLLPGQLSQQLQLVSESYANFHSPSKDKVNPEVDQENMDKNTLKLLTEPVYELSMPEQAVLLVEKTSESTQKTIERPAVQSNQQQKQERVNTPQVQEVKISSDYGRENDVFASNLDATTNNMYSTDDATSQRKNKNPAGLNLLSIADEEATKEIEFEQKHSQPRRSFRDQGEPQTSGASSRYTTWLNFNFIYTYLAPILQIPWSIFSANNNNPQNSLQTQLVLPDRTNFNFRPNSSEAHATYPECNFNFLHHDKKLANIKVQSCLLRIGVAHNQAIPYLSVSSDLFEINVSPKFSPATALVPYNSANQHAYPAELYDMQRCYAIGNQAVCEGDYTILRYTPKQTQTAQFFTNIDANISLLAVTASVFVSASKNIHQFFSNAAAWLFGSSEQDEEEPAQALVTPQVFNQNMEKFSAHLKKLENYALRKIEKIQRKTHFIFYDGAYYCEMLRLILAEIQSNQTKLIQLRQVGEATQDDFEQLQNQAHNLYKLFKLLKQIKQIEKIIYSFQNRLNKQPSINKSFKNYHLTQAQGFLFALNEHKESIREFLNKNSSFDLDSIQADFEHFQSELREWNNEILGIMEPQPPEAKTSATEAFLLNHAQALMYRAQPMASPQQISYNEVHEPQKMIRHV
ncbi:MAG: hypothetical protein M1561_02860 [Gammaproteobacteria bacterium]|nr:hypothetical protein [Gammaproteobacteria bacterium]